MVTVIKKGSSKAKIQEALDKLNERAKKGFKAHKFCGTVKLKEDPLKFQKRVRDEWK